MHLITTGKLVLRFVHVVVALLLGARTREGESEPQRNSKHVT